MTHTHPQHPLFLNQRLRSQIPDTETLAKPHLMPGMPHDPAQANETQKQQPLGRAQKQQPLGRASFLENTTHSVVLIEGPLDRLTFFLWEQKGRACA